jgi:hypothetical protein
LTRGAAALYRSAVPHLIIFCFLMIVAAFVGCAIL